MDNQLTYIIINESNEENCCYLIINELPSINIEVYQ